jgi:hypothetical protein
MLFPPCECPPSVVKINQQEILVQSIELRKNEKIL